MSKATVLAMLCMLRGHLAHRVEVKYLSKCAQWNLFVVPGEWKLFIEESV